MQYCHVANCTDKELDKQYELQLEKERQDKEIQELIEDDFQGAIEKVDMMQDAMELFLMAMGKWYSLRDWEKFEADLREKLRDIVIQNSLP